MTRGGCNVSVSENSSAPPFGLPVTSVLLACFCEELERDGTNGFEIGCDIIARCAVAARRTDDEFAVFVGEVDRQASTFGSTVHSSFSFGTTFVGPVRRIAGLHPANRCYPG